MVGLGWSESEGAQDNRWGEAGLEPQEWQFFVTHYVRRSPRHPALQIALSDPCRDGDNQRMENPTQILVVDDDRDIRTLLADYLDGNGFRTFTASNGAEMRKMLDTARIDLIVLDLTLPGEDGLTLCRNLRAQSSLPVIMLTARGEPLDRILGLEMGADDYLAKPFEPRELFARIRSVLRRTNALPPNMALSEAHSMVFDAWRLDLMARHLVTEDGTVVALSGAEFRLLKVFLEHPNRVLNRDQLLELTRGRDADPFDRSVDIQISRLRQKLGDDARTPRIIKTVRNEGYVLSATVSIESRH
jgi:two-component system OmpR family response regulator